MLNPFNVRLTDVGASLVKNPFTPTVTVVVISNFCINHVLVNTV